jgi:signal transduction histidine kinase
MKRTPRVSLRTVLIGINLAVLVLPVAGIQVLRLYESALVRQTESALIAQAAFVAAFYRSLVQERAPRELAAISREIRSANPEWRDGRWSPRPAVLDLADSAVLEPFPDARTEGPPDPFARDLGERLDPVLRDAQLVTLAGIRVVDPWGTIIASTGNDVGMNIAAGEEIELALTGEAASRLRRKSEVTEPVGLESISRAGTLRVFVAAPILLRDRVIGAVMLSRTPTSIAQALYAKRWLLLQAFVLLLLVVVGMSLVTFRLVARPVSELAERAGRVSRGELDALAGDDIRLPVPRIVEIARLQESITDMARTLEQRARYLQDFSRHVSHEFKTPIAGIRGAIEVLQDHGAGMKDEQRERFLDNIASDAERLHRLTERLMELTRAELGQSAPQPVDLADVIERAASSFLGQVVIDAGRAAGAPGVLCHGDALEAALETLFENAVQHEATELLLWSEQRGAVVELYVQDNGTGISERNRARIFDPFFTTDRERGGTGLGLTIAGALLKQSGASIELASGNGPTTFRLTLPRA